MTTPAPLSSSPAPPAVVLVSGASEALLIDGGFTYRDGQALVEAI